MKLIRNQLDRIKPLFEKGGKLEKYFPIYDSLETFAFVPNHTTKSGAHIRDAIDMKRTMFMVIIALVPCMLFGMWNVGHQHYLAQGLFPGLGEEFGAKFMHGLWLTLPLIIVSYGVGLGVEFIFCIVKKHTINEGFLVSGLLIPLIMPVDVPLWMVAVAVAFAVVFGKEVFGGTGMNILNVALTARAFLFFAYPTQMSGDNVWINVPRDDNGKPAQVVTVDQANGMEGIDAYTGATPLGDAALTIDKTKALRKAKAAGKKEQIVKIEKEIEDIKGALPSTKDAFLGFIPGSIGETSALACLIGAAILILTGIGSWQIMLSMIFGGYAMGAIFNAFAVNPFMEINPLDQLLIGGFMFGTVFMATDPVTAAQTTVGKYFYGFFAGFLAIMIRVFNPAYPEGVMLAILFMNVMAPLIDHYVVQANVNRRLKRAAAVA